MAKTDTTGVKQINRQQGLSLIELLIAIAIFAVLSLVAVAVFFTVTRNQTKAIISNDTYTEGQDLMKVMNNMIKQARSIEDTCTTSSQLALRMNDNSVIVYTTDAQNFLVSKQDCPVDEGSTLILSSAVKIEQLSFRINETSTTKPPSVTINTTITSLDNDSSKPQLRSSVDLESTIVLRSY